MGDFIKSVSWETLPRERKFRLSPEDTQGGTQGAGDRVVPAGLQPLGRGSAADVDQRTRLSGNLPKVTQSGGGRKGCQPRYNPSTASRGLLQTPHREKHN